MRDLKELQNLIIQGIEKIDLPDQPAALYEPVRYMMSLGGKRLRPALLLMACDLFGGDVESAVSPALAIEVFHNFTLVHDDIMDNAPLRRGKPTVHEKWGRNEGILSGDAMLVLSYQLLAKATPNVLPAILDVFSKTALGVCEGQQLDMDFENRNDVSIAEYLDMIRLKTAVLLGGALKMGALLGGACMEDADRINAFGENLGVAFQLQDDILDVYGDPDKFGKQVGGDILSNKKTFLLLKAFEAASKDDHSVLNHWMSVSTFDNTEKVNAVTAIYDIYGVREFAEQEMQRFADKAFNALETISLPNPQKQYLKQFADGLLVREN